MNPIWKFRSLALVIVLAVGGISISNLIAEFLHPVGPPFPLSSPISADRISTTDLAASIAPFRSDLKSDRAVVFASAVLAPQRAAQSVSGEAAQDAVKSALRIGPHDSRMWLVLALLQAEANPADPRLAESLKMSYLTGPNRAELIPVRLQTVTSGQALSDPDLSELARSDVRAILTHFPEQRQALVSDYGRASQVGKRFLEESAGAIDPKFVDALRGAK
jgi:hypothetical protein